MSPKPAPDRAPQEPLDPSRVVPYRRWTDPAIDNDMRIFPPPAPGQDPAHSLWAAGLMSRTVTPQEEDDEFDAPGGSWLSGLVKDEAGQDDASQDDASQDGASGSPPSLQAAPLATPGGRSWTSALDEPTPEASSADSVPNSWLAGLIKSDSRPAMNDITRLLFRGSGSPSAADEPTAAKMAEPRQNQPVQALPLSEAAPLKLASTSLETYEPPSKTVTAPPAPVQEDPFPSAPVAAKTAEVLPPLELKLRIAPVQPKAPVAPAPEAGHGPVKLPPAFDPTSRSQLVEEVRPKTIVKPSPPEREELPEPPLVKAPPVAKAKAPAQKAAAKGYVRKVPGRDKVSFYRSLAAMFEAGVPLFAIFEFLSREGESPLVSQTCRRIGQNLVTGQSLHMACSQEPQLFDSKAVRMMEVGYKGGQLTTILNKVAEDEEHAWRLKQMVKSQLTYPCCIALVTMAAVMLLPPFVLTELLGQVIALTSKPPALTMWLLAFSNFMSSPWTLGIGASLIVGFIFGLRTAQGRALLDRLEVMVWFVPALGPLWRNIVGLRFLRVFAMTYDSGLPATTGMELAASATGSQVAYGVYPLMKKTLVDGGSLADSFAAGGFLPGLALEAISAGEMSGRVPMMLENTAIIMEAEVESRIDTVAKMVEPLVLACLGAFVGVFVLGCLLPIVELTSTL